MGGVLLAVCLASCSVPVSADEVGADTVFRQVNSNALDPGEVSAHSRLVLHRANLADAWDDDPRATLADLHRAALEIDTRDRLFALAELSLHHGLEEGDRDLCLAGAVYAFLYLFGDAPTPSPSPWDRRLRLACEIYNRGVAEGFRVEGRDLFQPEEGVRPLPVGSLFVSVPDRMLHVGTQSFSRLRPAADYSVRGMTARIRVSGMGAPLVAGSPRRADPVPGEVTPGIRVGGTAFLEVFGELGDAATDTLGAQLTLHAPMYEPTVSVRGRDVPLESDSTTPLAYSLRDPKVWEFELTGFFSAHEVDFDNGLQFVEPYQPGKIPVVFVHGTASSPGRWAEMLNELRDDPHLRERFQFWLFIYTTGQPILSSAATLRRELVDQVAALDPGGADPALRDMVVIGHSQGGLLARLMITQSGDRFWRNASDEDFEQIDAPPETKEELRRALFFEPVPGVTRAVFIATPHRGSFLSGGILGWAASSLVTLPKKTIGLTRDLVARNVGILKRSVLEETPTAVDNMRPGHPFLVALAASPMDPGVPCHSIIAVEGEGPPYDDLDDGVVEYTSAHLDGVESEAVVQSFHSVLDHPLCIAEVRRILRLHEYRDR